MPYKCMNIEMFQLIFELCR